MHTSNEELIFTNPETFGHYLTYKGFVQCKYSFPNKLISRVVCIRALNFEFHFKILDLKVNFQIFIMDHPSRPLSAYLNMTRRSGPSTFVTLQFEDLIREDYCNECLLGLGLARCAAAQIN